MSKINISLVGKQVMPVNQGLELFNDIDEVVLIHSPQTIEEAEEIKGKSQVKCSLVNFDALDYTKILEDFEKLLDSYEADEIVLNITSGTKLWAIAFTQLAKDRNNCTLIYFEQNGRLQNLTQQTRHYLEENYSIANILKKNNQEIPEYTSLLDYTNGDRDVLKKILSIRSTNFSDFRVLTSKDDLAWQIENNNPNLVCKVLPSGSKIKYDKNRNTIGLTLFSKRGNKKQIQLQSAHLDKILFNTAWFEYEVALMISEWEHAKEIWLNVVFPYVSDHPKNEIDIIVSTGKRLLFIECKTTIAHNTDIDKFVSATRNFGGLSSKGLFVAERDLDNDTKEKCKDNRIMSFCLEEACPVQFHSDWHMNESVWNKRKKKLFELLNSTMFSNNT